MATFTRLETASGKEPILHAAVVFRTSLDDTSCPEGVDAHDECRRGNSQSALGDFVEGVSARHQMKRRLRESASEAAALHRCTTHWEFVSAIVNVVRECGCCGAQAKPPLDRVNRTFTLDAGPT